MKSIEIIMLPVANREKAKEFYLKLGFEIVVEAPGAHRDTWIQMKLPGGDTTISLIGFHGIILKLKLKNLPIRVLKWVR